MKKNPAVIGLIVSLLVAVFAFGIYFIFLAKKNYYLVDNPTAETYYYKINNGPENIITTGQFNEITLNKGKNRVAVYDANKKLIYDSAFEVNKIRGLLNITHSDYYTHRQYYGYNLKKDSLLQSMKLVNIDGKNYLGEPKKINQLYTEDFYFNIDEDYDKLIKNIDKVESRTKIFRKQDFLNYYKEYYKF